LVDVIPSHKWLGYFRGVPSAVRRGIFVEPQNNTLTRPAATLSHPMGEGHSPVGAASSARTPDDVAPTELVSFAWPVLQRFQSYGLHRRRALRAKKFSRRSGKKGVVFHKKGEALFPSFAAFCLRSTQTTHHKQIIPIKLCQA
jgi:hypothetical protein